MIRLLSLVAVLVTSAALIFSSTAGASDTAARLRGKEIQQVRKIEHIKTTLHFFERHPRILYAGRKCVRDKAWHIVVRTRARVAKERVHLRAIRHQLRMIPSWPPHHLLWLCIHDGEGDWHDQNSGGNGHYGGLQMHPGWGYGTSYYASSDSQLVQEWAAERAYIASGYSTAWLGGQWAQTIGPCWRYVR